MFDKTKKCYLVDKTVILKYVVKLIHFAMQCNVIQKKKNKKKTISSYESLLEFFFREINYLGKDLANSAISVPILIQFFLLVRCYQEALILVQIHLMLLKMFIAKLQLKKEK